LHERSAHLNQDLVLAILVRNLVFPFQFDADRVIVATAAAAKRRLTRVPGPLRKGHKLDQLAVAFHQQMRRYLHSTNLTKVGMAVPVQRIGEQLFNLRPAELSRRQANAMHDQHFGLRSIRARILIGAGTLPGWLNEPGRGVDAECVLAQGLPRLRGTTIVTVTDINCQCL